jgi:hypothetical protein
VGPPESEGGEGKRPRGGPACKRGGEGEWRMRQPVGPCGAILASWVRVSKSIFYRLSFKI